MDTSYNTRLVDYCCKHRLVWFHLFRIVYFLFLFKICKLTYRPHILLVYKHNIVLLQVQLASSPGICVHTQARPNDVKHLSTLQDDCHVYMTQF